MKRLAIAAAGLAVVVGIVVGACGGGNGEPTAPAGLPQQDIRAEDQAWAERINLTLEDFPPGWLAEEVGAPDFTRCRDLDFSDLTLTGGANSHRFARGEMTFVGSAAVVYDSVSATESAFDRFTAADFSHCLREAVEDELPIVDLSGRRLSFPSLGDRAAAFQIEVTLAIEASPFPMLADYVFVQRGRALAFLLAISGSLSPFSKLEMEALAARVARRMQSDANGEREGYYQNAELGFAFVYPRAWEPILLPPGYGVASVAVGPAQDRNGPVIGIEVQVVDFGLIVPAEDLQESLLEGDEVIAPDRAGETLREKGWAELGGLRARRYLVDSVRSDVPTTRESVITHRGRHLFLLTCRAQQDHFEEVRTGCQVVFESFQFTSSQ